MFRLIKLDVMDRAFSLLLTIVPPHNPSCPQPLLQPNQLDAFLEQLQTELDDRRSTVAAVVQAAGNRDERGASDPSSGTADASNGVSPAGGLLTREFWVGPSARGALMPIDSHIWQADPI